MLGFKDNLTALEANDAKAVLEGAERLAIHVRAHGL